MSPSASDKLRLAPTLTDVLQLVAMQGQAPIVARFALGLNRYTWGNPLIWRPCMNVWFGETKSDGRAACFDIFQSSESTRLMLYLRRGRRDLVELALSRGADPNLNSTALYEDRLITISTPLTCAIASKTLGLVRLILQHGADPNQVIDNTTSIDRNATPVLHAVWAGNLGMVRLLVDEYDVELPGAFPPGQVVPHAKIAFCMPLCSAIRMSRLSMVKYFISEKGVRVNFPHSGRFKWCDEEQSWIPKNAMLWGIDVEGDLQSYLDHALCMESPYMKCLARPISLEMVTFLLDAGALMNYTGGSEEEYPLLNAVEKKRGDVVTLMLSRGANPNLTSTWNRKTSIIGAAENNDVQMTIALLGAGAHVTGSILCEEATEFYQLMEEQVTALHLFAKHGNAQGVQLMLGAGAEVDAEALSGLTPLLFAVKGVDATSSEERVLQACACCRLLVEAGADIHHKADMPGDFFDFEDEEELNDTGFLALTFAVDRNVPALVICLVDLGADFTRCSDKFLSLLMHAAIDGKFEVSQALVCVAQGMEPAAKMAFLDLQYQNNDVPDDIFNGCNALHMLSLFSHLPHRSRIAKLLMKAGVSVLAKNAKGQTPLEAAVAHHRTKLVKMLSGH